MRTAAAFVAAGLLFGCAHGGADADALNARLLSSDSATAVLDAICGMPIMAQLSDGPPMTAPPDVRAALGEEALRHRRVRLTCGETVLSVADNWYRPSQLTEEMNRTLEATQVPFGRAVAALDFSRRRLESRARPGGGYVLEHRAVLISSGGAPFSYVIERYTGAAAVAR